MLLEKGEMTDQGKRGALGSAPGPASLPGARAVRQPELKEDRAESHITSVSMTCRLQREGRVSEGESTEQVAHKSC